MRHPVLVSSKDMIVERQTIPHLNALAGGTKILEVVLTQIYFEAKSGNGRIINYDIECMFETKNLNSISKILFTFLSGHGVLT